MNITVKKGTVEYKFNYIQQKTNIQKGQGAKLIFHKWICDDLQAPNNEVFFGKYTDSPDTAEELQARAEKQIKALLNILDEATVPQEVKEEPKTEE